MKAKKIPANETDRINVLKKYQILDTSEESSYNDLAKLASQICQTPISLVTLVDTDRQWFKAKVGLNVSETSREVSFCAHAINENELFVVEDAMEDERFLDNPLVTSDPNIRFYAGMPLVNPKGYRLGTLCVIDTNPRKLDEHQLFALKTLGKNVMGQMELDLQNRQLLNVIEKIDRQNDELSRLNVINTKLLSIISHDLRSPITTMSGFIDLIESEKLSQDEILKSASGIKNLLNASTDLLENLIQWGITYLDENTLKLQKINLHQLVERLNNGFDMIVGKKDNQLINNLDQGLEIMADSVRLRFILRNLIQNANKFTSEGSVTISNDFNDNHVIIRVTDTGQGIPPERIDSLFDWHKRSTTLGSSGERGSGLGLLLCKEFVESHGGTIKVSSVQDIGTNVTFTISNNLSATE